MQKQKLRLSRCFNFNVIVDTVIEIYVWFLSGYDIRILGRVILIIANMKLIFKAFKLSQLILELFNT